MRFVALFSQMTSRCAIHAADCAVAVSPPPRHGSQVVDAPSLREAVAQLRAEMYDGAIDEEIRRVEVCACIPGVRFSLSDSALMLLGLDDHWLVAESFPSLTNVGGTRYIASIEDVRIILDDLQTRADPGSGFDHIPSDRRSLAAAARRLAGVLAKVND